MAGGASRPLATASRAPSDAGAPATPARIRCPSRADPPKSTSRLSAKCRKKVRSVTPAWAAIWAAVVWSNPRSEYRARAASCSRPRLSGSHRPMSATLALTVTDIGSRVDDSYCHQLLSGGTVMRIFVTGASGWIGSAVVAELLEGGHDLVGLARSDASAQHHGAGDEPDGLAKAAADSDGVIHLAFQHEVAFSGNFAAAAAVDRRAVEAMGAALADSDRPFVLASGTLGLKPGRVATEDDGVG